MTKEEAKAEEHRIAAYTANENPEEDITDTIEELKKGYGADFDKLNIKPGRVMGFDYEGSKTYLEIGRIEDGRYFAKQVEMHEQNTVASHYRHNVDATEETIKEYGSPWCQDCEIPVSEAATVEGKKRYENRKERHLSDGTPIDVEPDEEQEG